MAPDSHVCQGSRSTKVIGHEQSFSCSQQTQQPQA